MFAERFRPTPLQYLRITKVALAGLAAIIVTGAAVRLTASGLGCSNWPTCEEGQFAADPSEFHAMVEFVNRMITGVVSLAVIVAVLGSVRRQPRRRDLTRWSWVLVIGVLAQIVIGAVVVRSELKYSVVAVHFLVSMVLVWAACVLTELAGRPDSSLVGDKASPRRRWAPEVWLLVALGTAVLVSGSLVTSAGFHPGAREVCTGGDEETRDCVEFVVERLPIDFISVVRVHSILVWCLCAATTVVALRLRRRNIATQRAAVALLATVIAQGGIGYLQYFNSTPALLVGFHVAGATLVWIMALRLAFISAEVIDADSDQSGRALDAEAVSA